MKNVKEVIENKELTLIDFEQHNTLKIEAVLINTTAYNKMFKAMTKEVLVGSERQISYAKTLRNKAADEIALSGCYELCLKYLGESDVDMSKWQHKHLFPLIEKSSSKVIDYCKSL